MSSCSAGSTCGTAGLRFTQRKTHATDRLRLELPLLAPLQRIIDATTYRRLTFLLTDKGQSFARRASETSFRQWCDEAGLKHWHGSRPAEGRCGHLRRRTGATPHQPNVSVRWLSLKQAAELYTRAALSKSASCWGCHDNCCCGTKTKHERVALASGGVATLAYSIAFC